MAASEKVGTEAGTQPPSVSGGAALAAPGSPTERFDEILVRLRGVVERLESGNLSLEDSLRFFEEGIGLCRRGATILDSAERKVEVLLAGSSSNAARESGGGGSSNSGLSRAAAVEPTRTVPFDVPAGDED